MPPTIVVVVTFRPSSGQPSVSSLVLPACMRTPVKPGTLLMVSVPGPKRGAVVVGQCDSWRNVQSAGWCQSQHEADAAQMVKQLGGAHQKTSPSSSAANAP